MHILSPRWLVPGFRYQWNGVENLRHFAKILSKFSSDCDNFQVPCYTRTSLNQIKFVSVFQICGNVSFEIMHIVVKIWDWANSILQFKIKLQRLWNKRALEFVSKQTQLDLSFLSPGVLLLESMVKGFVKCVLYFPSRNRCIW